MDFGALPPEINSLRMYTGPGSAPMLAAMTAWDETAAELHLTATAYESVIATLVSEGWLGPAAEAMTAAVVPYMTWMRMTAVQAEQTAGQAASAAAAFDAAFAMTVPPAAVAANRATLLMLVATNFLGINTPAIAATEAEYAEMWAQDATAMYVYAADAAAASTLTPFREPDQTTNPDGLTSQAAAVTQASGSATGTATQSELPQLMSAVPASLQQMASPAAASPFDNIPQTGLLADILNFLDGNDGNPYGIFLNSNLVNGFVSAQYVSPVTIFPATTDALADVEAVAEGAPDAAPAAADAASAGLTSSQSGGVSAGVNQASFVGRLSVPPSWTTAAEVADRVIPGSGAAVTAAPEAAAGMPGMPGMPAPATHSRSWGNGPRYGFKLTIMPRPVAAG
ncbi:PPE family protein [Mycobacterium sp. TY815]|uniref:PPE family protein n=1 Tax=Mycobacterium sp. TY815 TaxID=3050581 RepID=UPI002741906F|nr:PPE family protein [Mycobacterium sp. TY815]MDP7701982.1 PPE family protein [Mycobacterium sp. TY815]